MTVYEIVAYLGVGVAIFVTLYSLWKSWKVTQDIDEFAKYPESLDTECSPIPFSQRVDLSWHPELYYPSGSPYDVETGAVLPYTQLNRPDLIRNVACRYCGATNNPKDNLECCKCGAPIVVK
jgi:hypothetical protein